MQRPKAKETHDCFVRPLGPELLHFDLGMVLTPPPCYQPANHVMLSPELGIGSGWALTRECSVEHLFIWSCYDYALPKVLVIDKDIYKLVPDGADIA